MNTSTPIVIFMTTVLGLFFACLHDPAKGRKKLPSMIIAAICVVVFAGGWLTLAARNGAFDP